MFGGLLDVDGSARSSGLPTPPVSANEISLENYAICFLGTSCRLELSLWAKVLAVVMMSAFCVAISSLNSIVSFAFNSFFSSVFNSSLNSEMTSFSPLGFFPWLFGAFWMASRVFTRVVLMSQKPNYFCCSSEGGMVPSRLFGCGVKVT